VARRSFDTTLRRRNVANIYAMRDDIYVVYSDKYINTFIQLYSVLV
jgi:hypothetical protein